MPDPPSPLEIAVVHSGGGSLHLHHPPPPSLVYTADTWMAWKIALCTHSLLALVSKSCIINFYDITKIVTQNLWGHRVKVSLRCGILLSILDSIDVGTNQTLILSLQKNWIYRGQQFQVSKLSNSASASVSPSCVILEWTQSISILPSILSVPEQPFRYPNSLLPAFPLWKTNNTEIEFVSKVRQHTAGISVVIEEMRWKYY